MKKKKYFGILLVVMLLLTACGNSDQVAQEELDTALENMKNLESSHMSITMDIGTDDYTISTVVVGDYDKEGGSHSVVSMSLYGLEVESYTVVEDGILYTYTGDEDDWTYTKEEYVSSNELGMVNSYVNDYKSVKKVTSDMDGATKYEVTIDKDVFQKAMEEVNGESTLTILNDLVAQIYVKDDYIVKLVMDLSNVLDADEMLGLTKYTVTIEISNHNSVENITIPEEIKKNATLADEA